MENQKICQCIPDIKANPYQHDANTWWSCSKKIQIIFARGRRWLELPALQTHGQSTGLLYTHGQSAKPHANAMILFHKDPDHFRTSIHMDNPSVCSTHMDNPQKTCQHDALVPKGSRVFSHVGALHTWKIHWPALHTWTIQKKNMST